MEDVVVPDVTTLELIIFPFQLYHSPDAFFLYLRNNARYRFFRRFLCHSSSHRRLLLKAALSWWRLSRQFKYFLPPVFPNLSYWRQFLSTFFASHHFETFLEVGRVKKSNTANHTNDIKFVIVDIFYLYFTLKWKYLLNFKKHRYFYLHNISLVLFTATFSLNWLEATTIVEIIKAI